MTSLARIQIQGFYTIVRREITRIFRIWPQSLLPPLISTSLYYLIFGVFLGNRLSANSEFTYMQFIVPGLIMMNVLNNAYNNVVFSIFTAKFQRCIEELLVSPLSVHTILLGYLSGGILRGFVIGFLVTCLSLPFAPLNIAHPFLMMLLILFTSFLFSIAGFINALFAKKFDDTVIIPTFILTPMTYLGGIFYSIHQLSQPWKNLSLFNPILYLVNAFRYSFLGISDVPINTGIWVLIVTTLILWNLCLYLLKKGYGLRQ
jgi:ABC-2 type transport system permease protein